MTSITIRQPGKSALTIHFDTDLSIAALSTEIMHIISMHQAMQDTDEQYKWFRKSIMQKNLQVEETRIKYCQHCHAEIFPAGNREVNCPVCSRWSRNYLKKQLLKKAV